MEAHKPRIPSMTSRKRVADQATVDLGLATDLTYESQLLYSYGKKSYTPEELEAIRAVYDATLLDLDEATADLLDELRGKGLLENTVVVFTSDHGEQLGEHQLFGHRAGVFEPLLHVPLVISYPKEVGPRTVAEPVSNTRIFATLMDLVGLPGPATPFVKGSLLDVAEQPKTVFSETIGFDKLGFKKVSKTHPDLEQDDWAFLYKAVRSGNLKLIQAHDPTTMDVVAQQLFDLDADPDELHDLSKEQPGAAAELGRALEEWQDTVVHWTKEGADVPVEHEPSEAQRKQLEMLGYIEEE
jgi:arylsulfatase A-like enzyme